MLQDLQSRFKFGLLGINHNQSKNFLRGVDDQKKFEENLKTQPLDWYYRNNPISYSYNSLGFRCNDHSLLEDDYILFTGCSFTEGVGLHLENTYPYIVSKNLKKTYFNLATGGSGIDLLKDNLIMFLGFMKNKLPKYVVIQWPSKERSFFITENNICFINPHSNEKLFKQLIEDDKLFWTNSFNKFYILEYLTNLGINNVVEIGIDFEYDPTNYYKNIKVENVLNLSDDKARDLSHPGVLGHKLQAEEILKAIKTN